MGLGDLLNFDYGYGAPGMDLGGLEMIYNGAVGGAPFSGYDYAANHGEQYGPWQQYGPAGTINLPLADGQYGPSGTIYVPPGGLPYDQIPNYGTYPGDIGENGTVNPPSGPSVSVPSIKGPVEQMAEAIKRAADKMTGPSISMPKFDAPTAATIQRMPVPNVPISPPLPPAERSAEFRPMAVDAGAGLQRLMEGLRSTPPARPMDFPDTRRRLDADRMRGSLAALLENA